MPLTMTRLLGFEGPNLFGPQPGVALRLSTVTDVAARLRAALKDGGQRAGLVIGYLDVVAELSDEGYVVRAHFTTPTPALGVELARYAVAGLNARETGDETWDADEQIWPLQQRRRAEALPLPALQLIAEARRRGIPAFRRSAGQLHIGHGIRGMSLDLASFADDSGIPALPWGALGTIPIIAVSGGDERVAVAAALVAALQARNQPARFVRHGDFAAMREALCQPDLARVVVELSPASLFAHGLPFEQCVGCVITGLPDTIAGADDRAEIARATALPLLVTAPTGQAIVRSDCHELTTLIGYAACPVHLQHFDMHQSTFDIDDQLSASFE